MKNKLLFVALILVAACKHPKTEPRITTSTPLAADSLIIDHMPAGFFVYCKKDTVWLLVSERWATDKKKKFYKGTSMFVAFPYAIRGYDSAGIIFDEWMRKINMHNFIIWREEERFGDSLHIAQLQKLK